MHRSAALREQAIASVTLTIILLAALFLIAHERSALTVAQDRVRLLEEDLSRERTFSNAVFNENEQFRAANDRLRTRVTDLSINLSVREDQVAACLDATPGLQGVLANLSRGGRRIPLADVTVTPELVALHIGNVTTGIVAATGSMLPSLATDTVVLEQTPADPAEIAIGDIIVFEYRGIRVIHRVVEIGWDDVGWYARTRGDNAPRPDPDPVRFAQVRGVVVAVIY